MLKAAWGAGATLAEPVHVYMYVYVHVRIYIYMYSRAIVVVHVLYNLRNLYVYIYICTYMYMYMYHVCAICSPATWPRVSGEPISPNAKPIVSHGQPRASPNPGMKRTA